MPTLHAWSGTGFLLAPAATALPVAAGAKLLVTERAGISGSTVVAAAAVR